MIKSAGSCEASVEWCFWPSSVRRCTLSDKEEREKSCQIVEPSRESHRAEGGAGCHHDSTSTPQRQSGWRAEWEQWQVKNYNQWQIRKESAPFKFMWRGGLWLALKILHDWIHAVTWLSGIWDSVSARTPHLFEQTTFNMLQMILMKMTHWVKFYFLLLCFYHFTSNAIRNIIRDLLYHRDGPLIILNGEIRTGKDVSYPTLFHVITADSGTQ